MARPYEIRNLSRDQAEETAKRSQEDDPPPTTVQILSQPDGLYSVIAIYPDSTAKSSTSSRISSSKKKKKVRK